MVAETACMSGHQASPYAGRSERAGADCRGPGRNFLSLLCSACCLLLEGFSPALLDARGPVPEPPRAPLQGKAAKDSPVGPSLCSSCAACSAHLHYGLRCGPAEFRGAAAEGWIRRVKDQRRWCAVIGRRAASPPLNVSWGEQRTRPLAFFYCLARDTPFGLGPGCSGRYLD